MNSPEKTFWSGKLADYGMVGVIVGVLLWGARVYVVPLIEQQQAAIAVQMIEFPQHTAALQAIEHSNAGILEQARTNGELIESGLVVAPSDVLHVVKDLLEVQPSQVLEEVRRLEAKLDKVLLSIEEETL